MHLMLCVYDYITETVTICKLKLLGARLCISLGVLLLVLDREYLLEYPLLQFHLFLLTRSHTTSPTHVYGGHGHGGHIQVANLPSPIWSSFL